MGFSLLWPERRGGDAASDQRIPDDVAADLDLASVADGLCVSPHHAGFVSEVLRTLCRDPEVIRYRQDTLEDLLAHPDLAAGLEELLGEIGQLERFRLSGDAEDLLYEVTWRLGELEQYVRCVDTLGGLLDEKGDMVRSRGLRGLRTFVDGLRNDEVYRNLVEELPDLLARVRSIGSVTVGINLDDRLRPVEATLLSVNRGRFRGAVRNLYNRLFGRRGGADGPGGNDRRGADGHGIGPMHTMPAGGGATVGARETGVARIASANPMMVPLFRDLSLVLSRISGPIAAALKKYMSINSRSLVHLGSEIVFLLGAARLTGLLGSCGLPTCKPEVASREERTCSIDETYNINLALRMCGQEGPRDLRGILVTNRVEFGPRRRILILTGPNRGGKTTYTQAVGLAQVLMQAGIRVPGAEARMSPVDAVFTHFPVTEHPELEAGRLGEEAKRLGGIFAEATPHSLILFNESLSATSHGESLHLNRDVVRALRRLGARSVMTTHLHELAAEADRLNREPPDDNGVVSLVSQVQEAGGEQGCGSEHVRRTFKIEEGPPAGCSFAGEIASQYGISYEQLEGLLRKRGLLD